MQDNSKCLPQRIMISRDGVHAIKKEKPILSVIIKYIKKCVELCGIGTSGQAHSWVDLNQDSFIHSPNIQLCARYHTRLCGCNTEDNHCSSEISPEQFTRTCQHIRYVIKLRGQCRYILIKGNKCLSVKSSLKGSNTNQWERKDYSTYSSGTMDHPFREVKRISHKEKVDEANHIKTV